MARNVREFVKLDRLEPTTEVGHPKEKDAILAADLHPEVFAALKLLPTLLKAVRVGGNTMLAIAGDAAGSGDKPEWNEGGKYHEAFCALKDAHEAAKKEGF